MNDSNSQLINSTINILLNTLFSLCAFTISKYKAFHLSPRMSKAQQHHSRAKHPLRLSGHCTAPAGCPCSSAGRGLEGGGEQGWSPHEAAGSGGSGPGSAAGLCGRGGTPGGQRGERARSGRWSRACRPQPGPAGDPGMKLS